MQQINIKEYFKQQKDELRQSDVKPSLTIIDATNGDAGNQIYIQKKVDDFDELGWPVSVIKVPEHWTPADLNNYINSIDTDCIIAQMPLRDSLSSFSIDVIPTIKDCDGLTSSTLVLPATVRGIVDYLDDCGFKYEGKSALILGRSNIVGKPMAKELLARNMTVSICHSKTNVNAKLYLARIADLVVSAVSETGAKIMKFSEDFDNYAREVLHIENPFREFYRTQDSTFKTNIDDSITVDMEKYRETKINREEWVKLRNRYIAERILRELGYEVLLASSYFEDYPDAIPCDGATGQCLLDCRIKGCKYEPMH